MPELTEPTARVHDSLLAAMSEFVAEGRGGPADDTMIGREVREYGGHIGYDVRPSARRQGHAKAMLAVALPLARALGIDPALIMCDEDNTGSRKVIEANGEVPAGSGGGRLHYWVPTS